MEKKTQVSLQLIEVILYDEYVFAIDGSSKRKKRNDSVIICEKCNVEKTLIQCDGMIVCSSCGEFDYIIIDNDLPNNKEINSDKPKYPYKRSNHLIERLNRFQAKESTEIPEEVYNKILLELKKYGLHEKIKVLPYLKVSEIIKNILKITRHQRYYEHVPYIISKVTNKPPPKLSRELEDKIKDMFKQIQEPFVRHCPRLRINFLNYAYILHKFFRLLGYNEYSKRFPLRSKDKLRLQDSIWQKICIDLDWKYFPSI